jgi:hypothetical protein
MEAVEQFVAILKQAEAGLPVAGISFGFWPRVGWHSVLDLRSGILY